MSKMQQLHSSMLLQDAANSTGVHACATCLSFALIGHAVHTCDDGMAHLRPWQGRYAAALSQITATYDNIASRTQRLYLRASAQAADALRGPDIVKTFQGVC
jgi:hypothetical protein